MRQQLQEKYLPRFFWKSGGTITSRYAGAGELLGADALTHAAVEALAATKKVIIEVKVGWIAVEFRFYSDEAANTSDTIELYAASTTDSRTDHYRHFAQLTNLVGTQEYGSNKFIDTITLASENWLTRCGNISPANNTFASFVMNTHGHSHILAIASTLNSRTLGIEYKKV